MEQDDKFKFIDILLYHGSSGFSIRHVLRVNGNSAGDHIGER